MMKTNKLIAILLSTLPMLSVVGCTDPTPSTDEQGRIIINIFMNSGNTFEGVKKDSIVQKIEEEANVSLNISGATHNSDYYTTLNPMINTGDIPDVIFSVPSSSRKAYDNWVEQELLWNIDDLIAEKPGEYPYIEALLKSNQYKNIQFGDGLHTMIPLITSNSGWGIYYNAEWLINVGEVNEDGSAKTPETIEDVARVLQKFTENDPDQNGKDDTYGISPSGSTFYLNPLYHAFGVTTDYDLNEKGEATYMYMQPEFNDFLTWFNEMYNKGYVDPSFATNKNDIDRTKFFEGKVGMLITNAEQHVSWIANTFENAHGKDKLVFGKAPVGTKNLGKEDAHGFSDWGGWWGGYSISTDCKDPHAALRLFNYLYSPEGTMLRIYGIEGQHYEKVDGEIVPLLEGRSQEYEYSFNTNTDENGNKVPTGYHTLGSLFSGNFKWSDDLSSLTHLVEPKFIDSKYADLVEDAYNKTTLKTSKLTNVTGFDPEMTTDMKKIEDELDTFAIKAIMDKNYSSSKFDEEIAKINSSQFDWPVIADMIEELAKKVGVN